MGRVSLRRLPALSGLVSVRSIPTGSTQCAADYILESIDMDKNDVGASTVCGDDVRRPASGFRRPRAVIGAGDLQPGLPHHTEQHGGVGLL